MGWLGRIARGREAGGSKLHVGDPRFDDWDVVRDFEDLKTARAWRQHLEELGVPSVITSDWPLDQFERGDVAVRVPPGRWSDAEEALEELEEDEL
jgi:hypothetical protein